MTSRFCTPTNPTRQRGVIRVIARCSILTLPRCGSAPTGQHYVSPGQRPGLGIETKLKALKGRNYLDRSRSFAPSGLRNLCGLPTQGGTPVGRLPWAGVWLPLWGGTAKSQLHNSRFALIFVVALTFLLGTITRADDEPRKTVPTEETPANVAKSLTWHNSVAPAIEEARRKKASILVRVGAEWCGWCRKLDKEIAQPEVQKELANWVLVELDADAHVMKCGD